MKKKLISNENKKEIFYELVNAFIAGFLVFLGSCSTGRITKSGLIAAVIAGLIVAVTKLGKYWESEKKEYHTTKLFNFIP
jgi:hypothetical protein